MHRKKFQKLKEELGVKKTCRFTLAEDARGGQPHKVDRDNGIITGVKVIGLESPNGVPGMPQIKGRRYLLEALKAAIPLYEGASVNANHLLGDEDQPQVEDGFGELRNVRAGDDGLYADLHFLKSHPLAARVCEAAERMPRQFGLSPHHLVDGEPKGSVFVVSKIEEVFSVDLVRTPATTKGLFEERAMEDPDKKEEVTEMEHGMELEKKPEEMLEDEPEIAPLPSAAPTAQGVLDMLSAWKASLDAMTTKEEVFTQIDEMMAILAELGAAAVTEEEEPEEEVKPMESKRRTVPATGKVVLENKALRLCLQYGVKPSDVFLESLVHLGDEGKMKALIEERKTSAKTGPTLTPQRPKSSGSTVTESRTTPSANGFRLPSSEEYERAILN